MAENKKYHFRQILSTLLKEETNFSSAKQSSKLNSRRGIAKKPKNGLILSLTVDLRETRPRSQVLERNDQKLYIWNA